MTAGEFSDSVLNKSVQRVARAIDSDVHSKPVERDDYEIELFSYVMGRALVSCIREAVLVQRYANAEAHDAFSKLRNAGERLQDEYIARLLEDFGMPVSADNNIFELHFTDLIKYTGRLRGPQWRLVNLIEQRPGKSCKKRDDPGFSRGCEAEGATRAATKTQQQNVRRTCALHLTLEKSDLCSLVAPCRFWSCDFGSVPPLHESVAFASKSWTEPLTSRSIRVNLLFSEYRHESRGDRAYLSDVSRFRL